MKLCEHPFIESIRDESRRTTILNEIELLNLKDKATIFQEGGAPDALYLILEGTVAFTKKRSDGSHQTVSLSGPGTFFGEVGVFTNEMRALNARAEGKANVGRVPESIVKKIIDDAEPVQLILEGVIHHLKSTTKHYLDEVLRTEKLTLVGTMISSVLHDFKNPFSVISLAATLLEQKCADDPKAISLCTNIESQIQRMNGMANDLSAFARGDQHINIANISFDQLFEHFKELNAHYFNQPSISVHMNANGTSIQGDAGKLLRVFQNLIGNSIEAIRPTQADGVIKVIASDMGDDILITICDNGPGIPEKILANFFEPFITHGKVGGTGLGTAIVKSIVEAHNGSIDFESSSKGTSFNISLPKKHAQTA